MLRITLNINYGVFLYLSAQHAQQNTEKGCILQSPGKEKSEGNFPGEMCMPSTEQMSEQAEVFVDAGSCMR